MSLNDVCDTLRNHSGVFTTIRKAVPPSRNGLSHANMARNADMTEALFRAVFEKLQRLSPRFGFGHRYCELLRKFKRTINAIDSATIKLVASCISRAKHRLRKAVAKCHVSLNLQRFLPNVMIICEAKKHDSNFSRELCAPLKNGEIVVWDKAYNDSTYLFDFTKKGESVKMTFITNNFEWSANSICELYKTR